MLNCYLKKINNFTAILWIASILFGGGISRDSLADEDLAHKVYGSVDTLILSNGTIMLQGWAGESNPSDKIKSITITLNNDVLYENDFEKITRMLRPDVNKALGREDWIKPGWRLSTPIPNNLNSGTYKIGVSVTTASGSTTGISVNETIESFTYEKPGLLKRLKAYKVPTITAFGFGLLIFLFVRSEKIAAKVSSNVGHSIHPAIAFSSGLIAAFILLLAIGITGSSFDIGDKQTPFIKSDTKLLWGMNQPIRSDEWLVLTPNAIAQANHEPKFPIVNTSLGIDGQNMLIIGMAGVPVAHISQIVKPATWGYYLFDLKRALAWNWLFPIFSCLLALWAVLCNLRPGIWRHNFIISFTFSTAAYVVAWSNWPAYTLFFPCIVYLSAVNILHSTAVKSQLALGVLLGLAFSGFVLVLYPPWQISLTYVFIAITVGKVISEKSYRLFSWSRVSAYILGAVVSGIVLYAWWSDARFAIDSMEHTIYPGLRTTLLGGEATLEFLLRGFTNFDTLRDFSSQVTNQSEIASFYYMLLPLLTLFLIRGYQKNLTAVEVSLAVAVGFIYYFMFYGIPMFVAEYSLWGRVPGKRADLALGFACLVLTAMLTSRPQNNHTNIKYLNTIALISASAWTIIIYRTVGNMNDSITNVLQHESQIYVYGATLISGFLLARGSVRSYFVIALMLSASTTYFFNPIVAAPKFVKIESPSLSNYELKKEDRILALESSVPAMYLLASGANVVNGIFYYPQSTMWKSLDPQGTSSKIYNRYQHLRFYIGDNVPNAETFILENPGPDRVEVSLSPETFDFTTVSANIIIAPASEIKLKQNSSLVYLGSQKGWMWFSVDKR